MLQEGVGSGVVVWALLVSVGLVVLVLVVLALRTKEGQELAVASGVRLVKILLGWLEAALVGELQRQLGEHVRSARSGGGAQSGGQVFVGDGRLAAIRQAHKLVRDL